MSVYKYKKPSLKDKITKLGEAVTPEDGKKVVIKKPRNKKK